MQPVRRPVQRIDDPHDRPVRTDPLAGPQITRVVLRHDDVVREPLAYEIDDDPRRLKVDGRDEVARPLVESVAGNERPLHGPLKERHPPRRLETRLDERVVQFGVVLGVACRLAIGISGM